MYIQSSNVNLGSTVEKLTLYDCVDKVSKTKKLNHEYSPEFRTLLSEI